MSLELLLAGGGGLLASHLMTKSSKEKEGAEKALLILNTMDLNDDQRAHFMNMWGKTVEELRAIGQGGGPAQAAQAAQTAVDIAQLTPEKQAEIVASVSRISDAERRQIEGSVDKPRAIRELMDRKIAEAGAVAATIRPPMATPPPPSGPVEMTGEAPPPGTSESIITEYSNGQPTNGQPKYHHDGGVYRDFESGGGSY